MGKDVFRVYCASCHGGEARGDGTVAEYLKVPPADLTAIAARNDGVFPAERVALIIDGRQAVRGHGRSEMPVWGDSFLKTDDTPSEEAVQKKIADLVEFLRTIQKPAEVAVDPAPEEAMEEAQEAAGDGYR
jgi:mono/diheme cytochrome c family protein